MYEIEQSPWGQYERWTISHKALPQSLVLVPEAGACILQCTLNGIEILDGYTSPEELSANRWGKSGLLYPFPNRLANGQYTWLGKSYQFPKNDGLDQHALHGFGMTRPMEVVHLSLDEDSTSITLENKYEGEYDYYPWPFTVQVVISLFAPDQMWFELSLRNDGDTDIPAGLGWHPYFQLGMTIAEHDLLMPDCEMVGIDAGMIPTGKTYPYSEFDNWKSLSSAKLDNCFKLHEGHLETGVRLRGPKGTIRYWQESAKGQFVYLQAFTPPYGTSIALEPMTCNVDAFNNSPQAVALAPGQTLKAKCGVQWLQNKH